MAHVRFTSNFDYRPPGTRVMVAYLGGHSYTVKRDCAEAAVRSGKGIEVEPPAREERQKPVMRSPRPRKVHNAERG